MITGTVHIDITDVPEDRIKSRCAAILQAPRGARVALMVGSLKPDWAAVEWLRHHTDDYLIDVQGTGHAVQCWVDALRTGNVL